MKADKPITCKQCNGTGIVEWFDLDGMTIYSWQKPKTGPCPCTRKHHEQH